MASKSKKGRNPGAVDNWLDSIGLYRKNVAYDETCLFRAVSEQLFECQIYHERVRKEVVDYGRTNFYEFFDLLETEDDWYEHMNLLEKHMVVCGNIEIQIISQKYNRNVIIFDAARTQLIDATKRNLSQSLMLCLINEDHYDAVYKREKIQNAGFCQSIVYGILYEEVFKVPNVQSTVYGMLYDKEFTPIADNGKTYASKGRNKDVKDANRTSTPDSSATNIAPFPFKVAKALDPTIYRNIEYDSWTEIRREMRLGEWYYGDDHLILGTRCIFNESNGDTFECYIQDIIKNENKCIVYVTKLAEKRLVNYTDLSPENDAKPWPLPYRFSKNLTVSTDPTLVDQPPKTPKKRNKEKKRLKTSSESSIQTQNIQNTEAALDPDIKSFVGIPLQMQDGGEQMYTPEEGHHPHLHQMTLSQHNLLVTPEISSPMPKFSWDAPWSNCGPIPPEQMMWSPGTPQNIINYAIKPMTASAPVTPDVIPYHDTNYPYVYNYHVENPYHYNVWNGTAEYQQQAAETPSEEQRQTTDENQSNNAQNKQYQNSPHYDNNNGSYEAIKDRPTLCTSLPPSSPQVEMYSPIIPIPPGTPVIYAHPSDMGDLMMPGTPVQVFMPPVDMQYVSPGPYIYPPTPPTAWYPPGINSQGFIFPSPVNQTSPK